MSNSILRNWYVKGLLLVLLVFVLYFMVKSFAVGFAEGRAMKNANDSVSAGKQ